MTKTLAGLAIALAQLALPGTAQQAAQPIDGNGQFYLAVAGSGVFPYDPKTSTGLGLKAGGAFTAAFGYAFNEGISIEIEGGYQQVGIGDPSGVPTGFTTGALAGSFESSSARFTSISFPLPTVEIDGEIKTPSLMGNFYYRYPEWRVSPYVGFGLGAFFHDRTVISTLSYPPGFSYPVITSPFDFEAFPGSVIPENFVPSLPPLHLPFTTTAEHEDSRFSYQIMAGFLVRAAQRVDFQFGYRFRSSRGAPIDSDQIEAGIRFRL